MYKLTPLLSQGGVVDLGKKMLGFSCHTRTKEEASGVQGTSESFLKKGTRLLKYYKGQT